MGNEYHKIETLFERDENTFKVDPTKLKNPVYGIFKEWEFTEKIDGMNMRVMWDGAEIRVAGKTDAAMIPPDLMKFILDRMDLYKIVQKFGATPFVIYGEGYGAGIQKGGGYGATKSFIVFDVFIDNKWWLNRGQVTDIATVFGFDVVPFIGKMSLESGVTLVRNGFPSHLAAKQTGTGMQAEGLVGRPVETLFDKKGARIIIKLKTKDFAREAA